MSQNDNKGALFYGFNYPADNDIDLNSCGEISFGDGHTEYDVITTTDGTGIWEDYSDSIYIGDPPVVDQNILTAPNTNPYILTTPNPYTYTTGTTISIGYNKNEKYAVMELPRTDLPIAVYVCGRMLTLGILGTDVECAYTGDKLVFEPGAVSAVAMGNRITVSVEYNDEIYHYNVGNDGHVVYEDNSSTLVVTLVSTISKEGPTSGAK